MLQVWPDLLQPPKGEPMLRALLCHVDLWDPSTHALLALKHLMAALRMQPPPQSLFPTPAGAAAAAAEDNEYKSMKGSVGRTQLVTI